MRREIGKEYNDYSEYIQHQKKKTTNPIKRKKHIIYGQILPKM